jgi:hypothetical protein
MPHVSFRDLIQASAQGAEVWKLYRNKHPRWFSRETLVSERGMKENE